MDFDEIIDKLFTSQVFLPVHDQYNITGFQVPDKAIPLSIKDKSRINILVVFFSPDRGREFLKDYAEYQSGRLEDFGKSLLMNGICYRVAINPGREVYHEPGMVENLVQLLRSIYMH